MKRLIVTDLDGTLVGADREIPAETVLEIKAWQEAGHYWAIATGRKFSSVVELTERYDLVADALILENGALVLGRDFEILSQHQLADETVRAVVDLKLTGVLETCFVASYDAGKEQKLHYSSADLPTAVSAITLKYASDAEAEKAGEMMTEVLRENVFRNLNYVDIAPAGCSKGRGVSQMQEIWQVAKSETAVIGDSWNDVSMFAEAGDSFTMAHAEPAMQDRADHVVVSVHEALLKLKKQELTR